MNKLIGFLIISSFSFLAACGEKEYTVSDYKDKANEKIFTEKLAACRNNAKFADTVNCKNAERAHHDIQMQNMSGAAVPLPPMPGDTTQTTKEKNNSQKSNAAVFNGGKAVDASKFVPEVPKFNFK